MKALARGVVVSFWLLGLSAVACVGGEGSIPATVEVTPDITPDMVLGEQSDPTPTPVPATAFPVPSAVPTVGLPEIKSLDSLGGEVAAPDLPATFAPRVNDPALEALVRTTLSGYQGSHSVVVHNLSDGRSASFNERQVYLSASLFKMALLLEAYRQRDAGELDFGQLLTLEEEHVAYDFGTLEFLDLEVGDMITVADALRAMIIISDTPTAVMIQDVVNPLRADQTLRSLGINDMSVATSELPTTAHDMSLLIEAVASWQGVSEGSRAEMLSLLLQESIRGGIPSGVPPGSAVAHKTGNLANATHDVALIWGPAGPYVLAILSDRAWESEPLVAVSRAVWDYFAANP